jgi:hypothetical protein
MYYVGMRDTFSNILAIIDEAKEKKEELTIDELALICKKFIKQYDGEVFEDDKPLEERTEVPEEFKNAGMSSEAFQALMDFRKEGNKLDGLDEEDKEEEASEETEENIETTEEPKEINPALADILNEMKEEKEATDNVVDFPKNQEEVNELPPDTPSMGVMGIMNPMMGIYNRFYNENESEPPIEEAVEETSQDDENKE